MTRGRTSSKPTHWLLLSLLALVPAGLYGCGSAERKSDERPTNGNSAARQWEPEASDMSQGLANQRFADGDMPTPEAKVMGPPADAEPLKKDKAKPKKPKSVKTWKRSQIVPNTARIKIGNNEFLPLKAMHTAVRVDGFRARVYLDLSFENSSAQQYEGTFQLRLPNEASPFFLAFGQQVLKDESSLAQLLTPESLKGFDFEAPSYLKISAESWTQPKVARMVPRQKAALAYTSTVRRRVDPALLEWSGAGVFSARIFPITARNHHRVVIGYDLNLLQAGDALQFDLDFPAEDGLKKTLSLVVADDKDQKSSNWAVKAEPEAAFKESKTDAQRQYWTDSSDLRRVQVRRDKATPWTLVGKDKVGDHFAMRVPLELPADKVSELPRYAMFLVDTSLSSQPSRFNVFVKLLDSILASNDDHIDFFQVLFFNIETHSFRSAFQKNIPRGREALRKACDELALEGATDLLQVLDTTHRLLIPSQPSMVFLLSDGAVTWGQSQAAFLADRVRALRSPVFAYNTGLTGTNTGLLQRLTRETGGAVFSVVGEAEIKKAAKSHRQRPWKIESVSVPGGSDLLIAGRPRTVYDGQNLLIAGRGQVKGELTLSLSRGQEKKTLKWPVKALKSSLAPRIYGQLAVAQLEELRQLSEQVSTAYAIHYAVPGSSCSLLMLDTEQDYKNFGIKPGEESFVVKEQTAGAVFEGVSDSASKQLSDPKAAFLARLKTLETTPGVHMQLPASVQLMLKKLPKRSFELRTRPIRCRLRTWDSVPGWLQEQLASRELDYDKLVEESQRRKQKGTPADALKVLSSLVENRPGDGVLARDVAYSAMDLGLETAAISLFERVVDSRPFEPQSYHALAQAYQKLNRGDLAVIWYEMALAGKWNRRFGNLRQIVGLDYLRCLRQAKARRLRVSSEAFVTARLETIMKEFDLGNPGLLVQIMWNTDSTDIDLHVTDPDDEECYYEHRRTDMGGVLTDDVTQGYGPEMFRLAKPESGNYKVEVNFYSSNRNRASARTKVYVTIVKNWGRANERVERKVVTLKDGKQRVTVANVKVKAVDN